MKYINRIIIASMLLSVTALVGCQPKKDAQDSVVSSADAKDLFVVSKTVPVTLVHQRVCDETECTDFEVQTVETNHDWINAYFMDRFKKTIPMAFDEKAKSTAKENVEPQNLSEISMVVRYVGQNAHLATFQLSHSSYNAGAAHGMYHNEYVNFDLKQKKRIAVEDLIESNKEKELTETLYDTNSMWLDDHSVNKADFKLSDNFYFGAQGLVFVYPLYDLASYAEGESELLLPYHWTSNLIKPQYLPNLPKYPKLEEYKEEQKK